MQKYFLFLLLILFSCQSYQPTVQVLPPHIKVLSVKPFENKTNIYGLEDLLRLEINNELLKDGRFTISNNVENSDGYIYG
ncbi:MAG: hypothetical protein N2505_06795, partial [Endomicrobia bacterium]|nr:hypothetical protein [Endomicrobiia bacterium]